MDIKRIGRNLFRVSDASVSGTAFTLNRTTLVLQLRTTH